MNIKRQNQSNEAVQKITLKALQDELNKEDLEMIIGGRVEEILDTYHYDLCGINQMCN